MGIDPLDPEVANLISLKANLLAKKPGFTASDASDIEQHLYVLLVEKGKKLLAHTASQKTVFNRSLDNAARNLLKHRFRKKRDVRRKRDLDEAAELIAQRDGDLDPINLQIDVDEAMKTLPIALQSLARELMLSTPTDAARELKLTRGQMRHQMKLIARHFQSCGFLFSEQEPKRAEKLSVRGEELS